MLKQKNVQLENKKLVCKVAQLNLDKQNLNDEVGSCRTTNLRLQVQLDWFKMKNDAVQVNNNTGETSSVEMEEDKESRNAESEETVIIISPVSDRDRKAVEAKLHDRNIKVKKFIKKQNGDIVIQCRDRKSSENALTIARQEVHPARIHQEIAKSKLEFVIDSRDTVPPMDGNELAEELIQQNGLRQYISEENLYLRVIARKQTRRGTLVIVLVDSMTKKYLQLGRRGTIAWENVNYEIKDHVNIMYCYRCQFYGHTQQNCRNNVHCKYCGWDHGIQECNSTEQFCINCHVQNQRYNRGLDCQHTAHHKTLCQTYKEVWNKEYNKHI